MNVSEMTKKPLSTSNSVLLEQVRNYIKNTAKSINCYKFNDALISVRNCVNYVITNPVYTSKLFESEVLDTLCAQIGRTSYQSFLGEKKSSVQVQLDTVVFVASRMQSSGGHTRVIEDFLRTLPHKNKLVLVTEVPGRSDREKVEPKLRALDAKVEWAARGNLAKRLEWLQRRLIELRAGDVYLFNHHEDSVAVAAMQAVTDSQIHFYHHGDHHLCLGMHLKGARHIDIHAFGFHNCRTNLGISNNYYLPLVAQDLGNRSQSQSFMSDGKLTTCTAAGKNKLEVAHSVSYVEVIPQMLAATGGRHVHIGRLSFWAQYKIKRAMRKLGVKPEAFVYIPWVPSVWKALQEMRVDLFIASFPIVGGKTLVEVMGAGIPLIVHDHPTSRFLGGVDMVYPEAFCWRYPLDLLTYCKEITAAELVNQSTLARAHYIRYYHDDLLKKALLGGEVCTPPPLHPLPNSIDVLQEAMNINYHSGYGRITYKRLYRAYKHFRSWLTTIAG